MKKIPTLESDLLPLPVRRAVEFAHRLSGAPGQVVEVRPSGRYRVKLQYGERDFRWSQPSIGSVQVVCDWSIDGQRQKIQKRITIKEVVETRAKWGLPP